MPRLRVKVEDRWYDVDLGPWEGDRVRVLVDEEPVMVFLEGPAAGQGCGHCGSRHQAGNRRTKQATTRFVRPFQA